MRVNNVTKAYIQMHIAVLLFGLTAILGKYIVFEELALVWHRMWIAALGLWVMPKAFKAVRNIPRKRILTFIGIGIIVSLHWVAFFGSIKLGNVSVALACMGTATLFISLLEPLITKSKLQPVEIIIGAFVILGIILVLQVGSAFYGSIIAGITAAFLAALFSTLNKKHLQDYNSLSVSAIELSAGFIFLSSVIPALEGGLHFADYSLLRTDLYSEYTFLGANIHSFWYLLLLGILCTSVAYALALNSLKHLSAFSSGLAVNLEPIYGILMAIVLFEENKELNLAFYIGTVIILLSVFVHPLIVRKQRKKKK